MKTKILFWSAVIFLALGFNTKDGKKLWEQELEMNFQSSPTLVDDRIYLLGEEGEMIIVEAGREFKELGRSELGELSNCSPAFMDGRIYIQNPFYNL